MAINTRNKIRGLKCVDGRYTYDRVVNGVRIFHRFVDGTNEKTAELWISKKISEVISHKYIPESKNCSLTVRQILNAYWNEHLSNISSKYKVIRKYHLDRIDDYFAKYIIPAIPPLHGQVSAGILTASHVERYVQLRSQDKNKSGEHISPSTIQDEINILVQAINHCMGRSALVRITFNPIKGYTRPRQKDPSKFVLDEGMDDGPEWKAIFSKCSDSVKKLVLTLYETGMRPIEVFSMRRSWWVECMPDRWVIDFPTDFTEKTLKERRVPVSIKLLEEMRSQLQLMSPNDLFFGSPRTGAIRTNHWQGFENAVKRVKNMVENAVRFSDYDAFKTWAQTEKWSDDDIVYTWEAKGFTGKDVTPYALRRTRLSVWDAIDENASRYVAGHVLKKDSHNTHYIRFPLHRLFRLVGLEYSKADLRLVKSA